ncbi:type IV pili methyl-accepting chemotaxis transducer N-terminal domain-containing protein [Magnetovirga frankeli]|nr:type IV pili methyl-accepting chemotaxis transducer N-terminal domain-containing protein [gamma proteobacterium SS-5]
MVVLLLLAALAANRYLDVKDAQDEQYLTAAGQQALLAQRIAKEAMTALRGDAQAFAALQGSRDQLAASLRLLQQGDGQLPPLPQELAAALEQLEQAWQSLQKAANSVLEKQDTLLGLYQFAIEIEAITPQLQAPLEQALNLLEQAEAEDGALTATGQLLLLLERMRTGVQQILLGGEAGKDAAARFARDARRFDQVLRGLRQGDAERRIPRIRERDVQANLERIDKAFEPIRDKVTPIAQKAPELQQDMDGIRQIGQLADQLSDAANRLIRELGQKHGRMAIAGVTLSPTLVTLLGAMAVVFLLLTGLLIIRDARQRERISSEVNDRNQRAILRLLDEMGDLADGDLTVEATVTEDITGAIADSVNYAVEALRSLVTGINSAVHRVSTSALESRDDAMKLADASKQQAEQITDISSSIEQMATSADGMSKEAAQSAEVARKAVDASMKGSESVRNTIHGMDQIREQIQETAKRIKRLGESSQEIGDIVELIDDIADQTNILALNAAMQAAMAGEAGRGFAVVADEVQRLAERSGHATKQIEALVKTIQADTSEAVTSMESSTSGVVRVASLAEAAGESLGEIENVSNFLAKSTDQISKIAQIQSSLAGEINNGMSAVRTISEQSAEGTGKTAVTVGGLVDVAQELQQSVSGFRLP